MSNLDKKEKVGFWVAIAVVVLGFFGVKIPKETISIIEVVQEAIESPAQTIEVEEELD